MCLVCPECSVCFFMFCVTLLSVFDVSKVSSVSSISVALLLGHSMPNQCEKRTTPSDFHETWSAGSTS